jgi:hypothetical protein
MLLLTTTLKKQGFNCFLITFKILSASKAAFVSTELAKKACAYLFITSIDAINTATEACAYLHITLINATKADLFVYNITTKSRYIFIMFIGIIVNTSAFKKFTTDYKQF